MTYSELSRRRALKNALLRLRQAKRERSPDASKLESIVLAIRKDMRSDPKPSRP